MIEDPKAITYIGETDFRSEYKKFGIKNADRFRHIYIIGKTGTGKSTLIENMIAQDIANGNGLAFMDPHGASAEKMLDYIPEHRVDDVIYFAPFDVGYPVSFNVLEDAGGPEERHKVANGILSVMKKIWVDAFSGRMEYLVQNVLLALLEYPDATLLGFDRVLSDKEYRRIIVDNVKDPSVRSFWINDYGKWDDKYRREAGAAIQNKVGQFTSNPLIRNIIAQPKSSFDLRDVMDSQKIFIANLSKGLLGEQNAQLLGSMLTTKIYLAAMARARFSEDHIKKNLPGFYLYADEFQNFANDSFADILSEARKYKLSLTMAHQYVAQLPETVRDAVVGNVGTMIVFRIGPQDAELFEREFTPEFVQQDFVNLKFGQIYLRLSIDSMGSRPFSARTLPPIAKPEVSMKEKSFLRSRELYANDRQQVEADIEKWFEPIPSKKQLEHQEYLQQKKAEVEAAGGVWVESDYPAPPDEEEEEMPMKPWQKKKFPPRNNFPPRENNFGHQDDGYRPRPPRSQSPTDFPPRREFPPQSSERRPLQPRSDTRPAQPTAVKPRGTITVSPELKNLLSSFEKPSNTSPNKDSHTEIPAQKPISKPHPTVPLSQLSIPPKTPTDVRVQLKEDRMKQKMASDSSVGALKDILAKAQAQKKQETVSVSETSVKPNTSAPVARTESVSYNQTTTREPDSVAPSQPREVPEDVLRQILQ